MKLTTAIAFVVAAIVVGVASPYSILRLRPSKYSSSPMLLETPSSSSSVSRMLEQQRAITRRMFDMVGQQQQQQQQAMSYPTHRYELTDNNDKFELKVEVPGVKEEDIDVKIDEGRLTVQGRRESSSESSRFTSKFSKTFSLDKTVDADKFAATLKNGILTVSAPKDMKKLEENVRRIPVTTAAATASTDATDADTAPPSSDDESADSDDKTDGAVKIELNAKKEEAEEEAATMDLDKE